MGPWGKHSRGAPFLINPFKLFMNYKVTSTKLYTYKPGAKFMHCIYYIYINFMPNSIHVCTQGITIPRKIITTLFTDDTIQSNIMNMTFKGD